MRLEYLFICGSTMIAYSISFALAAALLILIGFLCVMFEEEPEVIYKEKQPKVTLIIKRGDFK
jgi:hypothetical protein